MRTEKNPIEMQIIEETSAIDKVTRAEIDMAISTAKRFPREIAKFSDECTSLAISSPEMAEACYYSLPGRGGKPIMGPSIRLAEIAYSCWGNCRVGARTLGESDDGKFIVAQGVCQDLERNIYASVEIRRRITTREGKKYGDDMIGVTSNAACSIALRNAILRVIPRALVDEVYHRCIQVATGGAKSLSTKRVEVFERLKKLDPDVITEERILAAAGRPSIKEITIDDVAHLIGLGTAIKDGVSIETAFPEPRYESTNLDEILPQKAREVDEKPTDTPPKKRASRRSVPKTEPELESGPPWETIDTDRARALKGSLDVAKLEASDLLEALGNADVHKIEDMPKGDWARANDILDRLIEQAGKADDNAATETGDGENLFG